MNRRLLFSLVIAIASIVIFWIISRTLSSVVIFIPGVIVTFIIYTGTFYRKAPGPGKILTLYLLALAVQFLHFTEEYLTGFTEAVPELLGQPEYPMDYWVSFNMIAYSVFILGGIVLYQKRREFMLVPLFFIVVGVLLNSVGHILLALYVAGYFPGLYTALACLLLGPLLMKEVLFTEPHSAIHMD